MKFCHSERTFHPDQKYTPPCNYYNTASKQVKILTGSLIGPTFAKEQPNFGLSLRFNSTNDKLPGPGSYLNQNKINIVNKDVKTKAIIRQYKKHSFIGGTERSPSIPFTNGKMDQDDEQYVKELELNEDLNKSALALKRKTQGYSFPKSPRAISNPIPQENPEPKLQTIAQYAQTLKQLSRRPKIQLKEQLIRTNQRRAEIINMINPQFVPSLELIELITKRRTKYTPGPGAYNQFTDENRPNEPGISFSASKRFSQDKVSRVGPGRYQIVQQSKGRIAFSRSTRNLFDLKNDTDLEHRFYIDPYENIRRREHSISKSQNQPFSFGSQVTRFSKLEKQPPTTAEGENFSRKQSKIQSIVQTRLKKLHNQQLKQQTQTKGLLDISTMASTIQ